MSCWLGLGPLGLGSVGLGWVLLAWVLFAWVGPCWFRLAPVGLGSVGLDWVRLAWVMGVGFQWVSVHLFLGPEGVNEKCRWDSDSEVWVSGGRGPWVMGSLGAEVKG